MAVFTGGGHDPFNQTRLASPEVGHAPLTTPMQQTSFDRQPPASSNVGPIKRQFYDIDSDITYEAPKKKKNRVARKECSICCDDKPRNRFPRAPHSPASNDKEPCRSVCFTCFENHITAELESKDWDKISCAECSKLLTEPELKKIDISFTGRVYQKWLDKAAKAYTSTSEEFRSCPSATCNWGCFMSTKSDGNIFRCQLCGFRYCILCEVPMHEDETCTQYQQRVSTRGIDEGLSIAAVKKCSKPCPECGINLDKFAGCDHVTCRKCKHEFCWLCFAAYRGVNGIVRAGNSAHAEKCPYHGSRLPSVPQQFRG